MTVAALDIRPAAGSTRPRIGFLGVGWIGRLRMEAMAADDLIEIAAVADPSEEMAEAAIQAAPEARRVADLDALLAEGLDGVVIATPSALHADQAIRALERGCAVFCQKPLARTEGEARAVVEAARAADRLLGVDLSYRHTEAAQRVRELVRNGALGPVHAADLVFHNAYGPDKAWFYDPALSGGGCLMDLGTHLVDFALWVLDFPKVRRVSASLLSDGAPLRDRQAQVEDYAVATLELETGAIVRIACSWRLQAGCDAVISASFHGPEGGAALNNVGGSFYDFQAEHLRGPSRTLLCRPPDLWSGRAARAWASRLAHDNRFDPSSTRLVELSALLDRIYEAAAAGGERQV